MKLGTGIISVMLWFGLRAMAGEAVEIELTGLADLGTSRIACLKVAGAGETITLHPGETASGIRLKDLNARAGWALVERGTNQLKLHLVEHCAFVFETAAIARTQHPVTPPPPRKQPVAEPTQGPAVPAR